MWFNRFSEAVSAHVSRPWVFVASVVLVIAWTQSIWVVGVEHADLVIEAISSPISLLLLVLLHNSTYRAERANDARSDQLSKAVAAVMEQLARQEPDKATRDELNRHARELVRIAQQSEAFELAQRPKELT